MSIGTALALIGAALAVGLPGIGSSIGLSRTVKAASGVLAEDPDKFGKMLVLALLPATQGLYGFVTAFLVLLQLEVFGTIAMISAGAGAAMLAACLPMAIGGLVSSLFQSNTAVSGIALVAKNPDLNGRAITLGAVIEMYALLGLIISFLAVFIPNWLAV